MFFKISKAHLPNAAWAFSFTTTCIIGQMNQLIKDFVVPSIKKSMTIFSKIIAGEIPSYKIAENEKFFAFEKACREIGITVPIIPGLKPIYTKKQLNILPKTFSIELPSDLSSAVAQCKTDEDVEKVGTEWLLAQSKELKKAGVPVLHYYTLGRPLVVSNVVKGL